MMVWEIGIVVIAISFLLLTFFSILYLLQLRRTAKKIESVLHTLNQRLPGVVAKLDSIAGALSDTALMVRNRTESLSLSVEKIQDMVTDIADFEKDIRSKIETPLLQTVGTYSAVLAGVRAFLSTFFTRP